MFESQFTEYIFRVYLLFDDNSRVSICPHETMKRKTLNLNKEAGSVFCLSGLIYRLRHKNRATSGRRDTLRGKRGDMLLTRGRSRRRKIEKVRAE